MDTKIKEAEVWYDKNKRLYEDFSREMENIIIKILKNQGILYQSVSHRVKEKESYLNKCDNEKYDNPVEEIMDVSGIRIIAYTNRDVSDICRILQEEFLIDEQNSINKADILETDRVGYLSVHYILQLSENRVALAEYKKYKGLRCEVQVRTLLQHAWAEIEHDRNYKFAGVLPKEIQRRFHLVAAVLEMMDGEFDKLSRDIDEYAQNMQEAVKEGDYNLDIDSKSLEQYMLKRFEGISNVRYSPKGDVVSEIVVQELLRFGYRKILDIEQDLKKCYNDVVNCDTTYIGILRAVMITADCKKYFNVAYKGDWQHTSRERVELWKKNGAVNVEKYLKEKGIGVREK